ncbi:mediator of RNA polymerase II transcription subunit 11 [Anopheles maculipalpis]|uniref:mediator of RNA polymerase II transcription subunit 11 n=1 Tax=Anopheles maculipalpis TaxID=1496333 RepID=UPI00215907EC|nr:mediator of RNA polymerase II transcription subunit 11 [Anopheles maculipalpis]
MTAIDKIQALDHIERELILCLQSAGAALMELSKEKTSQKATETNVNQFLKSLNSVETKLSEQINYLTQVSTGQPHEGSGYASAKVLQMAWHRIQHVKSRIKDLEECKMRYIQANRMQSNRVGQNASSSTAGVML